MEQGSRGVTVGRSLEAVSFVVIRLDGLEVENVRQENLRGGLIVARAALPPAPWL